MKRLNRAHAIATIAICLFVCAGLIAAIRIIPRYTPKVLVNQVGYWPDMKKIFVFQADSAAIVTGATFDVVRSDGTLVLANQPVMPNGSLWNNYYGVGNFTTVTASGIYHVVVRSGGQAWTSPAFTIGENAYDDVITRAVQFFYYQRCGYASQSIVPGYVGHELCHADDGYWKDEAGGWHWKDLSGGWHDAGDYGKYTESIYNTQYAVYTLAYTYDVLNGTSKDKLIRSNIYETPAPDIVDEAVWGARFLQKMIVEDLSGNPRVLCGIFGREKGQWNRFGYWGDPSSETNNIANDSDDRMSGSLEVVSGDPWYTHEYGTSYVNALESLMTATALARVAWVEREFPYWNAQPYNATNLLANATALHDAHMPMIVNGTFAVNTSKSWTDLWPALACTVELARWANATGNPMAWNRYVREASALRSRIMNEMNPWDGRDWVNIFDTLITLRHHDLVVNGSRGADLVVFLDAYGNQSVISATNNNPFNHVRSLTWIQLDNGTNVPYEYYFQYWGRSWFLSSASATAMIAFNATGKAELKWRAADNVVHWIMGRNPLDICQIESLGTRNLPLYHHRYASIPGNRRGAVPGCVPNGIARAPPIDERGWWKSPDLPWFDMRTANPARIELGDFRSNEAYITDNAGFLTGFATLASLW
ncbi:MAG: glycoside hydrolase family 9 protein [Candidatus Sigynarchaeota archaeon]